MFNSKFSMVFSTLLTAFLLVIFLAAPSEAAQIKRFKSDLIKITSPAVNNSECCQFITIEGTSSLNELWLCLRGPQGEITTYPVNVCAGKFSAKIWLRFGVGKYTVWAGDNNRKFDGRIRFDVQNTSSENYLALTPSGFVNSKDPKIIAIASSITNDKMTMMEKSKAVHDWVADHITYDTNAYYSGIIGMNTASAVIESSKGTCRDYSFVYAAIARAAGIPTKVVYGNALNSRTKEFEKHAWNQSLIYGVWVNVDTTWDAGYINNKKFIAANINAYFNADTEKFNKTHYLTATTLY